MRSGEYSWDELNCHRFGVAASAGFVICLNLEKIRTTSSRLLLLLPVPSIKI
jgi:hypothetical protein